MKWWHPFAYLAGLGGAVVLSWAILAAPVWLAWVISR